ncbi:MAG TPA: ABC transporter ATP-binding protein [Actinomycetota bacterium]|jgi:multiple sugar transport system ATP-binding protein|nr:ABC transporter ATP-binding protein [Actinomycetota bacterium]
MGEVELDDVTKVYRGGIEAVSSLDLDVPDGSFFVLVGPSGCGKTTVLRMVAGLEEVTNGTIRIGGRDVTDESPRDRDVAMVFQNYALYPHMTAYENIAFGLRTRRAKKDDVDRMVRQVARILEIDKVLDKRPRSLSGGQRQRVALGRAIVRQPQVFLMDEPLSNIDAKLRAGMRGELIRIQRAVGVTTLYVTHDQVEAMTLGDHVAVMRDGVLQQVGRPSELYDEPANLFVAGFIGTPPMNLVEATLTRDDGVPTLAFGTHRLGIDDRVFERHPRLRVYEGLPVVVGIRPDDLEHAALAPTAPADARMVANVERVDTIGRDLHVHFDIGAPVVDVPDAGDGDFGVHDDGPAFALGSANQFVARIDERTPVRVGDRLELVVNTARLHAFDPVSGEAVG